MHNKARANAKLPPAESPAKIILSGWIEKYS